MGSFPHWLSKWDTSPSWATNGLFSPWKGTNVHLEKMRNSLWNVWIPPWTVGISHGDFNIKKVKKWGFQHEKCRLHLSGALKDLTQSWLCDAQKWGYHPLRWCTVPPAKGEWEFHPSNHEYIYIYYIHINIIIYTSNGRGQFFVPPNPHVMFTLLFTNHAWYVFWHRSHHARNPNKSQAGNTVQYPNPILHPIVQERLI